MTSALSEPRRVQLRNEHHGDDSRYLDAYVDQDGGLHIDGQDLGPSTASVSGDGEYEYHKTVAAADIPALLELLGRDANDNILDVLETGWTGPASYDLERTLRESAIPVAFSCWS